MKKNRKITKATLTGSLCKILPFGIICVGLLSTSPVQVQAQSLQTTIVFESNDQSLRNGLDEIGRLSGFKMAYSLAIVAPYQHVSVPKASRTVGTTLDLLLAKTDLTYNVKNNNILIVKKVVEITQEPTSDSPPQQRVATGIVRDVENNPLPSATIQIKGYSTGVLSDLHGRYTLTIPDDIKNPVLIFSFVGMTRKEIAWTGTSIDVVLEDNIEMLEDVVVTGIFTKPKNSYTGAVRVISDKDLKLFRGRNIFTTLSNIDPSFNVLENNSWGSDPNRLPDIQIRGGGGSMPTITQLQDQSIANLNLPLIILDGFEISLQRMMDLNEEEIESIYILKDGSATALYGSRGANGIVVITTREPEAGKLRLSIRSRLNLSLPDLSSYNLLNPKDKLELERLSGYFENPTRTPEQNIRMQQYYNQLLAEVERGVNTDWMAKPLQTGIDQEHNVKLEGGDKLFRYALSLQYKTLEGVMKGSGRETFNGGINLTYKHDKLTFRNDLMIGNIKQEESPYGSFSDYTLLNPYWKPYDEDGRIVKTFTPYSRDYWTQSNLEDPYPNPLYNATLNTYDKSDYTSIINNFSIEWIPIESLIIRGSLGLNNEVSTGDNFKPMDHTSFNSYTGDDIFRKGSYSYSNGKYFRYDANLSVNYSKLWAEKHRVFAGLNVNIIENTHKSYRFMAEGFPDESLDFLGMALQYEKDGSPIGAESTIRSIGMVGSVNYSYNDKYLLDLSYRTDASSMYGIDNRYAPFWSTGIGWNLHHETFVKDNFPIFDKLKPRFSFGTTGSQNFSPYMAQATYNYYTGDRYYVWMGAFQMALGNKDLEWQKVNKYNGGIEMIMFKNRLILEADFYKQKTSSLISNLELPYSNGFTEYMENIGRTENQGFELRATIWLLRDIKRNINWSITGNLAYNKDKIVELSEAMKAANERLALEYDYQATNPNKIYREGDSQYTIYAVPSLGIDPSTGKELFLNRNGEVTYIWNAANREAVGIEQPKYRGNFSTMFRYRNMTMNVSFLYRLGGQIYNNTLIEKVEKANKFLNVDERVFTDRWKEPGDVTFFRGINDYSPVYPSSRFVQDESTLACQNLSLSYEIRGLQWMKNFGLQLMTITGDTGELFYLSSVHRERGTAYPYARQFSMSLSLMF